MNSKAKRFVANFSMALSANLTSLLVTSIVVLVLPKVVGVEEYSYWQLYLFYSAYVGFLHLGWNDGIYLRYGGREYNDLNKSLFFSQFYTLLVSQTVIALIIYMVSFSITEDRNRMFIFQMIALALIIVNTRFMLLFVLQATNRIKENARVTIIDRVVFIFLICLLLLFGVKNYELMIVADLVSKTFSLLYAMFCCKEIVFVKVSKFYFTLKETIDNISVGIKLMFANLASMLIIGVVRFSIERTWDVVTFGKVSLTLNLSTLMMTFINAVGIIMFPVLRRTNEKNLSSLFFTIRDSVMVILLGILTLYFPIKKIMSLWLPQYADSLIYLALLFPIFVYEGKFSILISTYFKTLRKEKLILRVNLATLILSFLITYISTQIFKNLEITVLSIVILLIFRSIIAEIALANILEIPKYKDIFLELTLIVYFIWISWTFDTPVTMIAYAMAYIIYLIVKRKEILSTIRNLKELVSM